MLFVSQCRHNWPVPQPGEMTQIPLYMKRRDLVQSHSNRILFIAQWFGCLETCPTDHRVQGIRVSPGGSLST